jgi:hypothetical protein
MKKKEEIFLEPGTGFKMHIKKNFNFGKKTVRLAALRIKLKILMKNTVRLSAFKS